VTFSIISRPFNPTKQTLLLHSKLLQPLGEVEGADLFSRFIYLFVEWPFRSAGLDNDLENGSDAFYYLVGSLTRHIMAQGAFEHFDAFVY
jgi:hypothetical protein